MDLGEIAQKDLNGFNHAEAMSQLFHRKSEGATQNTREEKKVLPCEDTSKKSYRESSGIFIEEFGLGKLI